MTKSEKLKVEKLPDETNKQGLARTALHPFSNGGITARAFRKGFMPDTDLSEEVAELIRQQKSLSDGDFTRADEMLVAHAHTLDAVFNRLLAQAARNMEAGYFEATQAYFSQALKAQNQCRNVWETISRMKNPPLRQTNIAHNQQINNMEKPQSKLMDGEEHERVDQTAQRKAIEVNSPLATLGTVHRTTNGAGQEKGGAELIQGSRKNTRKS